MLSDRQQDGCEPLLAIAVLAGGTWPNRARAALVEIFGGEAAEDSSVGVCLLTDIARVFSELGVERIFTSDLLPALCDLDPRWIEFSYGKPLSATALAQLLKRFEIRPRKIRIENKTSAGYLREWFLDAWARYTPRKPEQVEQGADYAGATQFLRLEQSSNVPAERVEESAVTMRLVPSVPLQDRRGHQVGGVCYIHRASTDWWESPAGSGNWLCSRCHPNVVAPSQPDAHGAPRVPTAHDLGFS